MKKAQTTTLAIGNAIVRLIQDICLRGDGVMIRHNGQDHAIVRVSIMGELITDDNEVLASHRCRIYRSTVPQLRAIAASPQRYVIRYTDATLVLLDTMGIWTWTCYLPNGITHVGYGMRHDIALDRAYAIATA